MTKVITSKDIRRAFTEKVNEYLVQGMEISVRTMSGSQGEISKVDLTDGKHIYRVRLERDHRFFEEDFFFGSCDTIELIVERYEDDGRNVFDTWGTLWSGKGELIEEKKWYSLDSDKTAFVDNEEEMRRIFEMRDARRKSKREVRQDITDDKKIAVIHKLVKKHKGYASVNKKAIEKVVKHSGMKYQVYFTRESKKNPLVV